jgi:hypothetical protein
MAALIQYRMEDGGMASESRVGMSKYVRMINGGSSSLKFALYQTGELLEQRLVGKVDRMLLKRTRLEGIRAHGLTAGASA